MKKKTTKPSIRMLLARLGRTKEAVAKKLMKLECHGMRHGLWSCPVAVYLRQSGSDVAVEGDEVILPNSAPPIALPKPVAEFVSAFDRGRFPELQT